MSVLIWQHIKLSKQIHPEIQFVVGTANKQPANKQIASGVIDEEDFVLN